jgi:hypothetical protein
MDDKWTIEQKFQDLIGNGFQNIFANIHLFIEDNPNIPKEDLQHLLDAQKYTFEFCDDIKNFIEENYMQKDSKNIESINL